MGKKQTMKAQVFYEPENMRLEEVDVPSLAPDEVLIKVKACGICGSDIAYQLCQKAPPVRVEASW